MAKYITAPFGVKTNSDRANPDKTQQCLTYDILSEGEIEGLENDLASVFINDVPVIDKIAVELVKSRTTTADTTSGSATITSAQFGTIAGLKSNNLTGLNIGKRHVVVEKAGAKGTGIASATAGTNLVTTSSSFFTTALLRSIRAQKVKGFVRVTGAGPNGTDLVTGASRLSATQIQTDSPVATTVSNADIFIDLVTEISSISGNVATLAAAPQVTLTGTNVTISAPDHSDTKISNLYNIENFKFGLNRGHLLQPPLVLDTSFGQSSTITSPNIELEQNDLRANVGTSGNLGVNYNATELDEPSQNEGTASDTLLTAAFLEVSNPSEIDEVHLTFQLPACHALKSSSGKKGASFVELQIFFEYSVDGGSSFTSELAFGPSNSSIQTRSDKVNFFVDGSIFGKGVNNGYIKPGDAQYTPFIEQFVINTEQFQPYDDWRIRIRRINDLNFKDGSFQHTNPCTLQTVESISKDKLIYPHTAYAALGFNAKDFDGKLPSRAYTLKGLKVQVPTNYRTRDETGGAAAYTRNITSGATESSYQNWDGNFRGDKTTFNASSPNHKKVYTDNPAWIFYDLVTNERYGLGQFVDKSQIDIYELFRIAKFCDEEIPDGDGGVEPRFTANIYLSKGGEATKVLKQFASIFRGMALWNEGQLTFAVDRPQQPVYSFSKANVIGGEFTYEGTGDRVRTNQIKVTWNDPDDSFRQTTEYVEDYQSIAETGRIVREEQLAFGCTSRGQAHRLGKWKLLSEQNEKETVSFSTGLNAIGLKPGDIINVQDSDRDRSSYSGRVSNTGTRSTTVIPLDRSISLPAYSSDFKHQLFLIYPKGGAYLQEDSAVIGGTTFFRGDLLTSITSTTAAANAKDDSNNAIDVVWSENVRVEKQEVTTSSGTVNSLTVGSAFSAAPDAEVMWALKLFNTEGKELTGTTKEYKIVSISEKDKHQFDIVAGIYFRGKFSEIERGFSLEPRPTDTGPNFDDVVPAPTNLVANVRPIDTTSDAGEEGTASGHEVVITWDFPVDSDGARYRFASGFKLEHDFEGVKKTVNLGTNDQSFSTQILSAGEYSVTIRTISNVGTVSQPISRNFTISSGELLPPLQSRFESLARGGNVDQTFTINSSSGLLSIGNSTYTLISPTAEIFTNTSSAAVTFSQSFAGMGANAEAFMVFDQSDSSDRFKAVQAVTNSTATVPITYLKEVGASNEGLAAISGTVQVDQFSNQVNGTGTSFGTDFSGGDLIQITNGSTTTGATSGATSDSTTVTLTGANSNIKVGMAVTGTGVGLITVDSESSSTGKPIVTNVDGATITFSNKQSIADGTTLTFTPVTYFGKVRHIETDTLLFLDEIVQKPYSGASVNKQSFVPDVARDFILAKVATDGSTNYSISEQYVATTGVQGPAGSDGLKQVQGYLYYEKTSNTGVAPSAPGTTTYTFSTGDINGGSGATEVLGLSDTSATDKWTNEPRTQDVGSTSSFWTVRYSGGQSLASDATCTVTYSAIVKQTAFTGVVTFSGGTFSEDGSSITTIDGANISTGTIAANRLKLSGSGALTIGSLTNDSNFITSAGAPVQSVNGSTGAVSITAAGLNITSSNVSGLGDAATSSIASIRSGTTADDVGLGNVSNLTTAQVIQTLFTASTSVTAGRIKLTSGTTQFLSNNTTAIASSSIDIQSNASDGGPRIVIADSS
tara:strand:+ start:4133 stop:9145 length:5013 start_codon:yes stop_codon:yes gene_type:complete